MRQLKRNRPWKVEKSDGPKGFSSVVCLFAVTFGVVLISVLQCVCSPIHGLEYLYDLTIMNISRLKYFESSIFQYSNFEIFLNVFIN